MSTNLLAVLPPGRFTWLGDPGRFRLRLVGYGFAPELRQGLPALANKWRSSPYAPPELTRGEWAKLGPRSDVFQLGMLAYELFRGAPCSPWVAYEELCENVQFLPAAMDELLQDCLDESERARRPGATVSGPGSGSGSGGSGSGASATAIVAVGGLLDVRPNALEMADHRREPFVQLAPEQVNFLRIGRELLLLPPVGHGLQQRQQRHRRRGNHPEAGRLIEQRSILLERRAEQRLERQEHHDEFRRGLELLPVFLWQINAHGDVTRLEIAQAQ